MLDTPAPEIPIPVPDKNPSPIAPPHSHAPTQTQVKAPPKPKKFPGLIEGRIVHFVLGNNEHRAAIVTKVITSTPPENGCCNLSLFMDWDNDGLTNGLAWVTTIPYSKEPKHSTWHWIEGSEKEK